FSLLCKTRKSGETATKPDGFLLKRGDFTGKGLQFCPATYAVVVPNARILTSGLFDFGKVTFPDFAALSEENRACCIMSCIQQVAIVDSTYRSLHHFPEDAMKYFASYTTTIDYDSVEKFFEDCPHEINKADAIEALRVNARRTTAMNRHVYERIKPDNVEFLVLLGLSFWNNEVALLNDDLCNATERNRAAILRELNIVYKSRGKDDYASRLGELLCFLDNTENNVSLHAVDVELYRLLNLFNEAF
ncbi:hypothetical protein PFISCL1PPCAC_14031, partial [Pristionchus fissidentatus]